MVQKVTGTGLRGKPRRLSLLIVSAQADEDQRRLNRSVYGN